MRRFEALVAGVVVWAVGCVPGPPRGLTPVGDRRQEAALLERAMEELPCKKAQIDAGRLDDGEYLAWGCGREVRYRVNCNGIGACLAIQPGERETVMLVASADLACRKALLSVRQADHGRFMAQGCGKRAEYRTECSSVPQGCAKHGKSAAECGRKCTAMLSLR